MSERRDGEFLDIEFMLKSGHTVNVPQVRIKVFDAVRQMKPNGYDKSFVWGSGAGVAVEDIAGWRVISQYED
jgi:hypothetical protein